MAEWSICVARSDKFRRQKLVLCKKNKHPCFYRATRSAPAFWFVYFYIFHYTFENSLTMVLGILMHISTSVLAARANPPETPQSLVQQHTTAPDKAAQLRNEHMLEMLFCRRATEKKLASLVARAEKWVEETGDEPGDGIAEPPERPRGQDTDMGKISKKIFELIRKQQKYITELKAGQKKKEQGLLKQKTEEASQCHGLPEETPARRGKAKTKRTPYSGSNEYFFQAWAEKIPLPCNLLSQVALQATRFLSANLKSTFDEKELPALKRLLESLEGAISMQRAVLPGCFSRLAEARRKGASFPHVNDALDAADLFVSAVSEIAACVAFAKTATADNAPAGLLCSALTNLWITLKTFNNTRLIVLFFSYTHEYEAMLESRGQ